MDYKLEKEREELEKEREELKKEKKQLEEEKEQLEKEREQLEKETCDLCDIQLTIHADRTYWKEGDCNLVICRRCLKDAAEHGMRLWDDEMDVFDGEVKVLDYFDIID